MPAVVASMLGSGCLAAHASAYIYWSNTDANGSIGRANLDGTGAVQNFIPGLNQPGGVAVRGRYIYWANEGGVKGQKNGGTIARANLNGTGVNEKFIRLKWIPSDVAVSGKHIYWDTNNGAIGRANLDGKHVNQHLIKGPYVLGLAVSATHIYWGDGLYQAIERANLNGTGVDRDFIKTGYYPTGVALGRDGATIYWTNGYGAIGRANVNGKHVKKRFIVTGAQGSPLAVDGKHVYWSNYGTGTIGEASLNGTVTNSAVITGAIHPFGLALHGP